TIEPAGRRPRAHLQRKRQEAFTFITQETTSAGKRAEEDVAAQLLNCVCGRHPHESRPPCQLGIVCVSLRNYARSLALCLLLASIETSAHVHRYSNNRDYGSAWKNSGVDTFASSAAVARHRN